MRAYRCQRRGRREDNVCIKRASLGDGMKIKLGYTICPFMSFHGEGIQLCRTDCAGYCEYEMSKDDIIAACGYLPD
jgi:hypothetical protein